MAAAVSYPGVYIVEIPGGSRAIVGVPTSVAAFVGYTARGPVDEPAQVFSFADFERIFGGVHADSPLSYAVNHFFLNGGAMAWIVRVAEASEAANVLLETTGGADSLLVTASSAGIWGNNLDAHGRLRNVEPGKHFSTSPSPRCRAARRQPGRRADRDPPQPVDEPRVCQLRGRCGERGLGPHPARRPGRGGRHCNGDERPAHRCRGRRTRQQHAPAGGVVRRRAGARVRPLRRGREHRHLALLATAITTIVTSEPIDLDGFTCTVADGRLVR